MPEKDNAEYTRKIEEAREIAQGIFDKDERRALLNLISQYKKLLETGRDDKPA